MCKVMVLKGIKDSGMALEFMRAVAPEMSNMNTDGIGYAAINSQNKLFAEKWHNNKQFLETDSVIDEDFIREMEPYKKRLGTLNLNYKAYGEVTRDDLRTVTMHTRYATCGKTFENTHPFVDNDMSLIHNGVISNAHALNLNKVSTCDSENALQLYNNVGLNLTYDPEAFQSFVDKLKGYWAFAFLAKNTEGKYMLDIVREGAMLYWAEISEMGEECYVFATTKDIIKTGLKALSLPDRDIFLLPESNYHRFDALTGEFIDNYIIDESILNAAAYHYYPSYNGGWSNKYRGNNTKDANNKPAENKGSEDNEVDEKTEKDLKIINRVLQGMTDEVDIDSFFNTEEPLIDRLYAYDALMGTSYGDSFEDMSKKFQLMLERKEEENYVTFDDILLIVEKFQATGLHKDAFNVYKEKRRA